MAGDRYYAYMLSRRPPVEPALRRLRTLSVIAVAIFGMVIAVITLWPGPPSPGGQSRLREFLGAGHANGIPTWITFELVEFVANIVMFLPVGFFGALVLSRHRWMAVLAATLASAVIETIQALALPQRDGTVRDVIANTLGALLGYLLATTVVAVVLARARRRRPVAFAPAPAYR